MTPTKYFIMSKILHYVKRYAITSKRTSSILLRFFHQLGISVSYDRVREVKVAVARSVCKRIEEDGVVLPTNMRSGVFTSGDMDNLDHKQTSNLSNDEFHGMAITLNQSPFKWQHGDYSWTNQNRPSRYIQTETPWPLCHRPPCRSPTRGLVRTKEWRRPSHDGVRRSETKDEAWITHVGGHLSQEELEKGEVVTWSGFHSKLHEVGSVKPPAEIGILPLFLDKSTDPGIIKHAMLIVKIHSIPQPWPDSCPWCWSTTYAIAKQLQGQFPEILGEYVYILMMGALHIEDKGQLMLWKFIRGSGWEWAMTTAEICTTGRVASTLDEHHIKRYAHQISLVALSLLRQEVWFGLLEFNVSLLQ